nr:FadR/GntR family transcriptional regulator [Providencia huaxiensis]
MTQDHLSVAESVMHTLAMNILNGDYQEEGLLPGENELATQLKVSRTSIRNGLQSLASKGLITIQPKRRSMINPRESWNYLDHDVLDWIDQFGITPDLFENLVLIRLIFEPNASALAAINASARDLANIEETCLIMKKALENNSRALFEEGDIAFHKAILNACHNPFLKSIGDALNRAMLLSFKHTIEKRPEELIVTYSNHDALFEAIRMRDSQLAKTIMVKIITLAAENYLPTFNIDRYNTLII